MNDVYCVFGASVPVLHMLAVSKQQTCMMCSYSASNPTCITSYSSYKVFLLSNL